MNSKHPREIIRFLCLPFNTGYYSGTAGDYFTGGLYYTNGRHFYTYDRDYYNCADMRNGGFWFRGSSTCTYVGLTSTYYNPSTYTKYGMTWNRWKNWNTLKTAEMKFRPDNFNSLDICDSNNGGCDHTCTSHNDGTRTCSCNSGYILDGSSCIVGKKHNCLN